MGTWVVKVQVYALWSATPFPPLMPVVSRAVYVVCGASGEFGESVAVVVEGLYVTVAGTDVELPAAVSVNVELVIVDGSIPVEKTALGLTPRMTPVPPALGVVEVTVGGAVDATGTTSIAVTSASSAEPRMNWIPSTPLLTVTLEITLSSATSGPTCAQMSRFEMSGDGAVFARRR